MTVPGFLRDAKAAVVLTGAGISAESGVPTFRGPGGMWNQYRPEELATPEAFSRDPKLVWEWYDWRRQKIARVEPNAGHRALVQWERRGALLMVITQNVDGLHDRAGQQRLVKLHGDIWHVRCTVCGTERKDQEVPLRTIPPRCVCGGLLRPGVVWFGEALPSAAWCAAEEAIDVTDALLVIGTSAVVYPAAGLAPRAKRRGVPVVEINTEDTPLSGLANFTLRGRAGEVLPEILR